MTPVARDGLPARSGGAWTQDKLTYLKKYASGFMVAMAKKQWERLVYIDLLAGPGLDINNDTRQEFDGSPLIALQTRPAFHHLYLGDASRDNVTALRKRIPPQELKTRVDLDVGDCHRRVQEVIKKLPRGTLGLAFVDPEGFEVKFELFQQLARAQLDILFLFPTGGATRNLRLFAVREKSPLDDLIEGWRYLPIAKRAAGKSLTRPEEMQLQRTVLGEFRRRMGQPRVCSSGSRRPRDAQQQARHHVSPSVLLQAQCRADDLEGHKEDRARPAAKPRALPRRTRFGPLTASKL
jgi:three-Cys-motif partner protein